jgi:nucleotide-binding universal stress UspA family protein
MNPEPIVIASAPEVTVVLRLESEPAHLVATLRALAAQADAPSFELLLILSPSTDDVRVACRRLCDPYAVAVSHHRRSRRRGVEGTQPGD